jgi:hypothetical protein
MNQNQTVVNNGVAEQMITKSDLTLYLLQTDKSYDVNPQKILMGGTSDTCNLNLCRFLEGNTRIISRCHFKIEYIPANGYAIADLRSMNGTWVNDIRLKPGTPLFVHDTDRIRVANNPDFTIEVVLSGGITTEKLIQPSLSTKPKSLGLLSGVYYDAAYGQFIVDGHRVDPSFFSKTEHNALRCLVVQPGRVRSYDELAIEVWNGWVQNNTIAKTVGNIRRKLDDISPGASRYIQTIRGRGFRCRIG